MLKTQWQKSLFRLAESSRHADLDAVKRTEMLGQEFLASKDPDTLVVVFDAELERTQKVKSAIYEVVRLAFKAAGLQPMRKGPSRTNFLFSHPASVEYLKRGSENKNILHVFEEIKDDVKKAFGFLSAFGNDVRESDTTLMLWTKGFYLSVHIGAFQNDSEVFINVHNEFM